MSFPKLLALLSIALFGIIGIAALFKGSPSTQNKTQAIHSVPVEVELDKEIRMVAASSTPPPAPISTGHTLPAPIASISHNDPVPDADRIEELFNKGDPKSPIVQTIVYKSRVPWQKGRPAWISDYASHYSTSRHFIARSLNGKADYFKQDVAEGDRFNVLHPEKNINFYLVIDTSRSKMWFYYIDLDANERVLLKTYSVGLGRYDSTKPSGMLTPLGRYSLGDKVAIYKPKTSGFYNGQKIEMVRVFGTRWIPFAQEINGCTAPAEGLGIHGVPWLSGKGDELVENIESLGKYESDGCIRLATNDVEELFAIIITRPTTVELVKDFYEAKLPGVENTAAH